jgi:uncharacterized protein (DUF2336 family)
LSPDDPFLGQKMVMAAAASAALIAELDGAVRDGSPERRVQILRQVTDLFLSDADRLNETQISVFDDVLVRLIERVEARTLAHLSVTLSEIDTAPRAATRQLAFHDDASVAVPVLTKSNRLSEKDLIEIANTRGQQHLLAISGRETLNEALTDVLMRRGDIDVSNALAQNLGARFSENGYATLVGNAERDEGLTEKLGLRLDIPAKLLRELLAKATDAVRARLLKAALPAMQEKIQSAIAVVAEQIGVVPPKPVDYTEAQNEVVALNRAGKLNDSMVNRFAVGREYSNVMAALSFLSTVGIEAIEPLMKSDRLEGLIVACKAARLSWSTTTMIIRNRPECRPVSCQELEQGVEVFEALSLSAAQRTIRFWSARSAAKKNDRSDTAVAVFGI